MPASLRSPFAGVACLIALLAASGCGSDTSKAAAISGKVTYKNEPVPGTLNLQIAVEGTTEPAVYHASIGADGQYITSGIPNGAYQVSITPASAAAAPMAPPGAPKDTTPPMPGTNGPPPKHVDIPLKYLKPATSKLTLEIKGGAVKKDFDLLPD